MWDTTIKGLYQNRLKEKIDKNSIVGNEDEERQLEEIGRERYSSSR